MTATVERISGGKIVVRAQLRDWHAAGRFLHFTDNLFRDVDLAAQNPRDAERTAHYVNERVAAKAKLEKTREQEASNV